MAVHPTMAIHLQSAVEQQEAFGTESKFSEGGNSSANKSVLSSLRGTIQKF